MQNRTRSAPLFFLFLLAIVGSGTAEDLRLPPIYSDHAVLQREKPIQIHGYAKPGAAVTANFDNASQTATADAAGRWQFSFAAHSAGGPYTLTVSSGKEKLQIKDLLVGDVWLSSGQSNMHFPMKASIPWTEGVLNAEQEIAAANYPRVRFFIVPVEAEFPAKPEEDGTWEVSSPETACNFSGVSYYFAIEVFRKTGIPIGILSASVGGTPIDAWMESSRVPAKELATDADQRTAHAAAMETYIRTAPEYYAASRGGLTCTAGSKTAYHPEPYTNYLYSASGCYNAMIYPLRNYPIKGFIWYQGESNARDYDLYVDCMQQLISNWRRDWSDPTLPFYYVQIANRDFRSAQAGNPNFIMGRSGELRFQQYKALTISNTGMAVAADVGDPQNIHPRDKKTVGTRMTLQALRKTYGMANVAADGPLYTYYEVKSDQLIVHFNTNGSPLVNRTGSMEPDGFEIAGEDGKFIPAISQIKGDTVVLHSPAVKKPVAARYGAGDNPWLSLYNSEGLPAPTFTTR